MKFPDEIVDETVKRLSRAEGQVRAVKKMIAEGSDCNDVITQLTAAIKALETAGFRLIASGVSDCVRKGSRKSTSELDSMEKMFLKLS